MDYSSAHQLAREIRSSEEYQTYHSLKESVMAEEGSAAMIREYRKLQVALQMDAMSGRESDSAVTERFSALSTLLFSNPEISAFLLAEMRLQQALADIFRIVTEAADVDTGMPDPNGIG